LREEENVSEQEDHLQQEHFRVLTVVRTHPDSDHEWPDLRTIIPGERKKPSVNRGKRELPVSDMLPAWPQVPMTPALRCSRKESARLLGMSIRSLDYRIEDQIIKTIKEGRNVMILYTELVRYSRSNHFKSFNSKRKTRDKTTGARG
jgi:hypothetical protein